MRDILRLDEAWLGLAQRMDLPPAFRLGVLETIFPPRMIVRRSASGGSLPPSAKTIESNWRNLVFQLAEQDDAPLEVRIGALKLLPRAILSSAHLDRRARAVQKVRQSWRDQLHQGNSTVEKQVEIAMLVFSFPWQIVSELLDAVNTLERLLSSDDLEMTLKPHVERLASSRHRSYFDRDEWELEGEIALAAEAATEGKLSEVFLDFLYNQLTQQIPRFNTLTASAG